MVAAAWVVLLLLAAIGWAGRSASAAAAMLGAESWLALLVLFWLNHGLRFARWHLMLAGEGYRVPLARGFSIFLGGLALLPTPGKAGVTVRSVLLLHEGVPANVSLAAYFAERLFDLLGLVALATLILGNGSAAVRWTIALAVGGAGVLAVRVAPWFCKTLQGATRLPGAARRALGWANLFFEHAGDMVGGRRFLAYLALGMAANVATGALLWFALASAGSSLSLATASGIVALSHLSGSLSLLPGGLGGFELALLAQLSAFSVDAATSIAALLLVRIATLWGSVAVGLPLLFAGLRRLRSASRPRQTAQ